MKKEGLLILTSILCVAIAQDLSDAAKIENVVEAAVFGQKKLEEFRLRNPIDGGGRPRDGIPLKSEHSNSLEADAIKRIEATKHLMEKTGLTAEQLMQDPVISSAFSELMCPPPPPINCGPSEYRTMDGSCNNLQKPDWGKSFTPQRRFLGPVYSLGDKPRDSTNLPSARALSNKVFKTTSHVSNEEYTGLVMAWGQLIDHDIVKTPTAGDLDCCDAANADNPICYPIAVPAGDNTFSGCLTFVRSAAAPASCLSDKREQINELTAFIDGGMLYGSSEEELAVLRDQTNPHLMKTKEPGNLLPAGDSPCTITDDLVNDYCQKAGDERVNVIPTLGSMHIMLVREHNRIARELAKINLQWSKDKIFKETRKIMGAIIQHISYNEWLPLVIGDDAVSKYNITSAATGNVNTYNPNVDPSIRNAFAAAALRYGHTLIMPTQSYLDATYKNQVDFSLASQQLNPHIIEQNNGGRLADLVRWASYKPAMASDRMFEDGIRNHLFGNSDLPARNVQRGRDHGLPPYNKYRKFCGLSEAKNFGTGIDGLKDHSSENAELLKSMYNSVDDIDLYVGGITENLVVEGEVGPTFACLIGKQFEAIKKGDAYWYENPGITGFSTGKVNAIKQVTLSSLLCRHFGLATVQPKALLLENSENCPGSTDVDDNCMIPCSDLRLRPLDLRPWKVL